MGSGDNDNFFKTKTKSYLRLYKNSQGRGLQSTNFRIKYIYSEIGLAVFTVLGGSCGYSIFGFIPSNAFKKV